MSLQRYGADALGLLFDRLCDTARAMHDVVEPRRDFVALHEPACNILCFRWVGDGARGDDALDRANAAMRERYNRSGEG